MYRKAFAVFGAVMLSLSACDRPIPIDPEIAIPTGAVVSSNLANGLAFAPKATDDLWECWQSYRTSTRDFSFIGEGATKAAAQLKGKQLCVAKLRLAGLERACASVNAERCEQVVDGGPDRETDRKKPRLKACAGTLHRPRGEVKFQGKQLLPASGDQLTTAYYTIIVPASAREISVWCRVETGGDGWWCDGWKTGSTKGCDDNYFITTRRSLSWNGRAWEVRLKFENESRHENRWLYIYYDYT